MTDDNKDMDLNDYLSPKKTGGHLDLSEFFDSESIDGMGRRLDLERRLAELSIRELGVLYLYTRGSNQAEIGHILGLSQRHVGRILEGIAKKAADL